MKAMDINYEQRLRISGKIKHKLPLDEETKSLLVNYGINPSVVKYPLQKVVVNTTLGDHSGIGCINVKGGMEFYSNKISPNESLKDPSDDNNKITVRTLTIGKNGIVIFRNTQKRRMKECYLLSNIFDYYALRTLQHEGYFAAKYPVFADYIVLNNVKNVLAFICESEIYDVIHCMLPRTEAGLVLSKTLKRRNPGHINDDSDFYSEFMNLTEYLYNLKKNLPNENEEC